MTISDIMLETALDSLRPGLDADGFELHGDGRESDGTVRVTLRARSGACLDCLVPDDLLVQLIEDAIAQVCGGTAVAVKLVKLGFD